MIRSARLLVMVAGLGVGIAQHDVVHGMEYTIGGAMVAEAYSYYMYPQWTTETAGDFARWVGDSARIAYGMATDAKRRKDTSALTASSPFLAYSIYNNFLTDVNDLLELGAGHGSLSYHIARSFAKRSSSTRYDIVECDHVYFNVLRPRMQQFNAGIHPISTYCESFNESWKPRTESSSLLYDAILSTLPWTIMSDETQKAIQKRIIELLKPGGKFIWVSLAGAKSVGAAKAAKKGTKALEAYTAMLRNFDAWLENNFDSIKMHYDRGTVSWLESLNHKKNWVMQQCGFKAPLTDSEYTLLLNVTPMRVYVAIKKQA